MAIEKATAVNPYQPIKQKEDQQVSKSIPVNAAPKVAEKNEKPSSFTADAPKSALAEIESSEVKSAIDDGIKAIKEGFNSIKDLFTAQQPPAVQAQAAAPKNDQVAQLKAKTDKPTSVVVNDLENEALQNNESVTTDVELAAKPVDKKIADSEKQGIQPTVASSTDVKPEKLLVAASKPSGEAQTAAEFLNTKLDEFKTNIAKSSDAISLARAAAETPQLG